MQDHLQRVVCLCEGASHFQICNNTRNPGSYQGGVLSIRNNMYVNHPICVCIPLFHISIFQLIRCRVLVFIEIYQESCTGSLQQRMGGIIEFLVALLVGVLHIFFAKGNEGCNASGTARWSTVPMGPSDTTILTSTRDDASFVHRQLISERYIEIQRITASDGGNSLYLDVTL